MGWNNESAPGHEGYIVGIVPETNTDGTVSDWRYRELCFDTDGHRLAELVLQKVQVGCECGWRSPRLDAPAGTVWWPSIVDAPEWFEERARLRWHEHIDLESRREPKGFGRVDRR